MVSRIIKFGKVKVVRSRFNRDNKGISLVSALMLVVLLYVALFLPFRFNILQYERNVILATNSVAANKAAIDGGVTDEVRDLIIEMLTDRGIAEEDIIIEPATFELKNRGENINIRIMVRQYPEELDGITAIGGTLPPAEWFIYEEANIMSEYLP